MLEHAGEALKRDKNTVLAAIMQDGDALACASATLRRDPLCFAAAAPNCDPEYLCFPDSLLGDRDAVLMALVKPTGDNIMPHVHERFRSDRTLVLAAVTAFGTTLYEFDSRFQKDREIVFAAVSNRGEALQFAHSSLQRDKACVWAAIAHDPSALSYAHDSFRRHPLTVHTAVLKDGRALQYACDKRSQGRLRHRHGCCFQLGVVRSPACIGPSPD